jgi:putative sterol carrier protein
MARFLSPAWLAELAAAAEGVEVEAGEAVTVQQVVVRGSGEATRWALRVADGRVAVAAGGDPHPDVTLTTDRDTAVALARGALAVTDAFMAGRIRVGGDLEALLRGAGALAAVDAAFASVRDRTTWDA